MVPEKVVALMRPLLALVLLALAGCAAPPDAATDAAPAPAEAPPAASAASAAPPPPSLVRVVPDWVQPGERFEATTSAPGAVDWFLAKEGAARDVALDTGALAPGASASVSLDLPGRYLLRSAWGERVVVAVPDAPPAEAPLRLSGLAPMLVAPGALAVENDRAVADRLVLVSFAEHLASGGARIEAATHLQGALSLVARARGDGAEGNASLLVDALKPEPVRDYPPFRGAFDAPVGGEARTHELPSEHPVATLTVWFNATSEVPLPAAVQVALVSAEGEELANVTGPQGAIEVGPLPAGRHTLVVRGAEGLRVAYEATARAVLVLERPARPLPDDHQHTSGPINPCDPDPLPPTRSMCA